MSTSDEQRKRSPPRNFITCCNSNTHTCEGGRTDQTGKGFSDPQVRVSQRVIIVGRLAPIVVCIHVCTDRPGSLDQANKSDLVIGRLPRLLRGRTLALFAVPILPFRSFWFLAFGNSDSMGADPNVSIGGTGLVEKLLSPLFSAYQWNPRRRHECSNICCAYRGFLFCWSYRLFTSLSSVIWPRHPTLWAAARQWSRFCELTATNVVLPVWRALVLAE
ncbi:hypothetical protein F4779DRAFT_177048 [Xylariaceae sp. FL0662B]|nr:hypothetical protein F4779DRAFT_177048 [Xylariaceae sp. FL0662B]